MGLYPPSYFLTRTQEENTAMVDEWVRRGWATRPRPTDNLIRVPSDKWQGKYHKWQYDAARDAVVCFKCGITKAEQMNTHAECV